jgi:hypothetical protein
MAIAIDPGTIDPEEPIFLLQQSAKFHSMLVDCAEALRQAEDVVETIRTQHGSLYNTWVALQRLITITQEAA